MKTITVLSGKGGVGKSSLTASLAVLLAKQKRTVVADCDVDAADLGLVLGLKELKRKREISTNEKAEVNKSKCRGCKNNIEVCSFSAMSWDENKKIPVINKFLCEGCGACQLVYPEGCIEMKKIKNAVIGEAETDYGFLIVSGQLKMGESGSGKVVAEVKKQAEKTGNEVLLVDSAAGIGCPVIASVQGSDFVIGVTEPTPSALSDLKRALQVVEHFRVPYGVIINRWDLNKEFSKKIEDFLLKNKIPLLGKIPYDRAFVEALVNLKPIVVWDRKFEKLFSSILEKVLKFS